ncbi:MAG: SPOR domain-containing protein [Alphaproteobacteria bacterium]
MASTTHDGRLIPDPDERIGEAGPDALGEDEQPPPRRRRRGLTAAVVVVGAVAVAAGVWYLTQKLSDPAGETAGELPLLIAETEPVKVKPKDPGGAEIPNRGTYVYRSLENEPQQQPVEQLLPAPEEPLPKPVDTGPKLDPVASVTLGDTWKPEPPAAETEPDLTALLERAVGDEQAAPADAPEAEAMPSETPAEAVNVPAFEPEVIEVPASSPETAGTWLQVAALQDQANVDTEWARLVKRYPQALGTAQHRVVPADLGARGLWYRVQAGPFADVPAAEAACRSIAASGGSCQVVKP